MEIKLAGDILYESIVDGEDIRTVVFTQYCNHLCKGCHNPSTWSKEGGVLRNTNEVVKEIVKNTFIKKVTFSGGDPLEQSNECLDIILKLKKKGFNDFWLYTGYLWKDILKDKYKFNLIKECNVVIDGPFEIQEKSFDLKFKGSYNQRIIDVKQSLKKKSIVLYIS